MTKLTTHFTLLILLIIFSSACAGREPTQAEPAHSPPLVEEYVALNPTTVPFDISVTEMVDVEAQFIAAYRKEKLTASIDQKLDINKIEVSFQSWSPNQQYVLLRIKTGDILKGKFPSDPSGDVIIGVSNLWLANTHGLPLYQLAVSSSWPSWSPDSSKVAYTYQTNIEGFIISELWMVEVASGHTQKLSGGGHNPIWLNDETIIFIDTQKQLQLVDIEHQTIKPLIIENFPDTNLKIAQFALSSNRQNVAIKTHGDSLLRIGQITNEKIIFLTNVEVPNLWRFSWAPDNDHLVLSFLCISSKSTFNSPCNQIQIIQTEGEVITRFEGYQADTNISWSPDSHFITFRQNNILYLANLDSSQVQPLYQLPTGKQANTVTTHWSPDGKYIGLNEEGVKGAMILTLQIIQ